MPPAAQDLSPAASVEDDQPRTQLPDLREPLGWRSLSDAELGARVMWLLDALQAPPVRVASSPVSPSTPTASSPQQPKPPAAVRTSSTPASAALARWGRLGLSLPWLVVLAGIAMTLPVLVWAPLLGGLCFGMLAIQVGIIRRWARQRWAYEQDHTTTQETPDDFATVQDSPAQIAPRLPAGWLLLGFLALTAMLAAVLLTTLHIKSREPAAAADALRLQRQPEPFPGHPSNRGDGSPAGRGAADVAPTPQDAVARPPFGNHPVGRP